MIMGSYPTNLPVKTPIQTKPDIIPKIDNTIWYELLSILPKNKLHIQCPTGQVKYSIIYYGPDTQISKGRNACDRMCAYRVNKERFLWQILKPAYRGFHKRWNTGGNVKGYAIFCIVVVRMNWNEHAINSMNTKLKLIQMRFIKEKLNIESTLK